MHAWIRTAIFLLVCLPVASPDHAQAVDVAFWTPYRVDADTYGLFPLDRKDLTDTQGSATFQSIETVGEVAFETQGKFGGAIRLDGRGAIRGAGQDLCRRAPGGRGLGQTRPLSCQGSLCGLPSRHGGAGKTIRSPSRHDQRLRPTGGRPGAAALGDNQLRRQERRRSSSPAARYPWDAGSTWPESTTSSRSASAACISTGASSGKRPSNTAKA